MTLHHRLFCLVLFLFQLFAYHLHPQADLHLQSDIFFAIDLNATLPGQEIGFSRREGTLGNESEIVRYEQFERAAHEQKVFLRQRFLDHYLPTLPPEGRRTAFEYYAACWALEDFYRAQQHKAYEREGRQKQKRFFKSVGKALARFGKVCTVPARFVLKKLSKHHHDRQEPELSSSLQCYPLRPAQSFANAADIAALSREMAQSASTAEHGLSSDPAWADHLRQRVKRLEQAAAHSDEIIYKHTPLDDDVCQLFPQARLLERFCGNRAQECLHDELCQLLTNASKLDAHDAPLACSYLPSIGLMASLAHAQDNPAVAFSFVDAGYHLLRAARILADGMARGTARTLQNFVDFIHHPVQETARSVAASIKLAGKAMRAGMTMLFGSQTDREIVQQKIGLISSFYRERPEEVVALLTQLALPTPVGSATRFAKVIARASRAAAPQRVLARALSRWHELSQPQQVLCGIMPDGTKLYMASQHYHSFASHQKALDAAREQLSVLRQLGIHRLPGPHPALRSSLPSPQLTLPEQAMLARPLEYLCTKATRNLLRLEDKHKPVAYLPAKVTLVADVAISAPTLQDLEVQAEKAVSSTYEALRIIKQSPIQDIPDRALATQRAELALRLGEDPILVAAREFGPDSLVARALAQEKIEYVNWNHIMHPEVSSQAKWPSGLHSILYHQDKVISHLMLPPDEHGVTAGFYSFNGWEKFSTFVPQSWGSEEVIKGHYKEALNEPVALRGWIITGQTKEGVKINFHLKAMNSEVSILTAFPLYRGEEDVTKLIKELNRSSRHQKINTKNEWILNENNP